MPKVALITGITGQDGAYLAELLLKKGYTVHGLRRRSSSFNSGRIEHLYSDLHESSTRFFLHYGDLTDATNLIRLMQQIEPDELYNLGAQSHVYVSFETPEYTANADGLGTMRLLETIRILGFQKKTRFYQASTSEMYGKVVEVPQTRNDAVLSAQPLCGRQALCLLDHGELPRGLRHPCLQRHPVQPRRSDPRRDVRHPQDHARGRRDQRRHAEEALPRQSRRQARLGPCPRLRRRHVADAADDGARRLRAGDRRDPQRAGVRRAGVRRNRAHHRLEGKRRTRNRHGQGDRRGGRRSRSALLPPDRGRVVAGRRRPRRARSSAGCRRSSSPNWFARWSRAT